METFDKYEFGDLAPIRISYSNGQRVLHDNYSAVCQFYPISVFIREFLLQDPGQVVKLSKSEVCS